MEDQVIFRRGNKVILRPIIEDDITKFFIWMNDPEVTKFNSRCLPVSLKQEMEWFQKNSDDTKKINLAIVDAETNNLIGSMGMHNINYVSRTATTGAIIGNKEYWGKGYGGEAKMLFLHFAFYELNLRKIYSEVLCFNERSINYSLKCGYVKEAILPMDIYKDGRYWDKVILAVYREQWEKLWIEFSKKLK